MNGDSIIKSGPALSKGSRLLLATHNAGKMKEMRELLAPFGVAPVSAGDLGLAVPEETGTRFEDNAAIKAKAAAKAGNMIALADDSGLEVEALEGAPGVYTADWAEQADGSRDFYQAMRNVEEKLQAAGAVLPAQRKARFVSVLCLAGPSTEPRFFRGEVEGHLIWPPRGQKGFGYDPVFVPDGHTRSFGEMEAQEKHGWKGGDHEPLSHRARAFRAFALAFLSDSNR